MSITEIAINIVITCMISWGIMWTLFPWGFGSLNFKQKYGGLPAKIATVLWYALIACHVVAIYILWTTSVTFFELIGSLVLLHVFYGSVFCQNVSTR